MKIELSNVSKNIKNNVIIDNINLSFYEGNIYALYGKNGTGKSVFLKLLAGYYETSTGEVRYDDTYNLGTFIEKPTFYPQLTGYQNLKLLANINKKIGDSDINYFLKLVELYEDKDKKYSKYSLGMKQKLGIVQAIMENPDIIILDEPFNGVDDDTVEKLIDYIKSIKKNKIIFISSHIKEDLLKLTDNIYYFDNGKIIKK